MREFRVILVFLYALLSSASLSASVLDLDSETVENADIYFLMGYKDFLDGQYGAAAESFYQATVSEGQPEIINKARFYLSLTQAKLGNKKFSASNAAWVNQYTLLSQEKELFKELKYLLGNYYNTAFSSRTAYEEQRDKLWIWGLPYIGIINYSAESTKSNALFYGAYASFAKNLWSFSAGGESFDLRFRENISDYSQTQAVANISRTSEFGTTWSGRYAQIFSSTQSQTGIQVLGLGVSKWVSNFNKIIFDTYYSSYPNSSLGNMGVYQGSLVWEHWFHGSLVSDFWVRVGDQVTHARAADVGNGSSFIQNKIYNRIFGEVNFRWMNLFFGGTYWLGDEVFGVRSDGAVVYSGVEEHVGGYGGNIAYQITPDIRVHTTLSSESLSASNVRSKMTSIFAMLAIKFK
jgi:hypothetical protein